MQETNNKIEYKDLICPYCGYTNEECNFPDLFYPDNNNTDIINEQLKLLEGLQSIGYNIVTCGMCGNVFIQKRG